MPGNYLTALNSGVNNTERPLDANSFTDEAESAIRPEIYLEDKESTTVRPVSVEVLPGVDDIAANVLEFGEGIEAMREAYLEEAA